MQRTVRRLSGAIAVGLLGLTSFVFFARLGDGPTGPLPGGALSGQHVDDPIDWVAVAAREAVEVQIGTDAPRSVMACLLEFRGEAYLSVTLAPLKRWQHTALEQGSVVVRIGGLLHTREVRAVRDPDTHAALKSIAFEKYQSYEFGDGWAGRNLEFLHIPPQRE